MTFDGEPLSVLELVLLCVAMLVISVAMIALSWWIL